MKCNKCNHTLPDDSVFCQYCGSRRSLFEREETPHTPSAAPRHYKLAPITDPTPREMLNNISIETITDEDERQNLEQYKKLPKLVTLLMLSWKKNPNNFTDFL